MNAFLQSPWLKDLGWVLVHSLWQGAVLWALLALVFALGRHRLSAALKHRMAWLTLTLLALAPVVTMTWMQMGNHSEQQPAQTVYASATPAASAAPTLPATSPEKSDVTNAPLSTAPPTRPTDAFVAEASKTSWLAQLPIWLATAWLAGLTLLIIRLLFGWRWIAGLKHTGAEPEPTWGTRFLEWSDRAMLRHVRVLVCPTLGVPLVVGWLRPVICFPASLLSRLTIAEVEALMLHELAHLKRRDPLLQFWVTVVETLLFHNPAAHALASTVRQTGELACDDLVLQWKGDGKTYARALAAAEEWRGAQFALAATGMGSLKHRIQRILGLGEHGRLTSLPERFGITSVAGIAFYFVVCGLAVPRIARALTPEERISVITQEREALKVAKDDEKPSEFKATGFIHTADGSQPTDPFTIIAWSQNYTAFFGGVTTGQSTSVHGQGGKMFVAAWIPGYAPSITSPITRDPKTSRGTFELIVERGSPALLKFVNKAGQPIPNADVKCSVHLAPGCDYNYQSKLGTDDSGSCSPGNLTAGQSLKVEVRAFGYEWRTFDNVRFSKDTPTTLKLQETPSLIATVVDAQTQNGIPGVHVFCMMRRPENNVGTMGFGYPGGPQMSASPSDSEGRLNIDLYHPDDGYDVVVEAPGYARKALEIPAHATGFHVTLEPELVLSGVIEDPEKKLRRRQGKVFLSLETWLGEHRNQVRESEDVPVDEAGRIPFKFLRLGRGKTTLTVDYDKEWETNLQSSVEGLVFRLEGNSLKLVTGPEHLMKAAPIPTREVEIAFTMPHGIAPFNGDVAISMSGKPLTYHKVSNNRCTLSVPVGAYFEVNDYGIPGYGFDGKGAQVKSGDGALHMEIRMKEAGAISGDIHLPHSFPTGTDQASLTLMTWTPEDSSWKVQGDNSRQRVRVLDDGAKYFISPVTLNRRYKIVARHGMSFVETPSFEVDNSHPLVRQDITFREGETIRGIVLQPDGTPMTGGAFYLHYKEPFFGHSGPGCPVKPDGTFELPAMNFDITGMYFVSIPGTRGIAPLVARVDGSSSNIKLQRQAGHSVDFELVDPTGAPISGLKLRFAPKEIHTQTSIMDVGQGITSDASDLSGRIKVTTFLPGEYGVYLDVWNYLWASASPSGSYSTPTVRAPASAGRVYKFVLKKREPKP